MRGYEEFPKKFIARFFKINKRTVFSKQKIGQVSELVKALDFVDEKKKPEILFKKDSTHVYLFLEKNEISSFDGLVGFATREKELTLTGNIDLRLNNIFDSGEVLTLLWNKVAKEKSEFELGATIPYVFNSLITTEASFDLYRQDSTFLNAKFDFKTVCDLNHRSSLAIFYSSEKSNYLPQSTQNNFDSYSNHFLGLEYRLLRSSKRNIFRNKYQVNFNMLAGKRKTASNEEKQYIFNLSSFVNIKANQKSYIHINGSGSFLSSKSFLSNELFRIGGVRSVRGFDEQSIFTSLYSYVNFEYRYFLSSESFLYSITDLGIFKNINLSNFESLLGLGVGCEFQLDSARVNLSYAIGKKLSHEEKNNPSKLVLKLTSFF